MPRLRKIIDAAGLYHPDTLKVMVTKENFAGVPCLQLTPKRKTSGVSPTTIIYLHGGGYVFGSPEGYKPLLAQLAINSDATVVAVDYRLAPEHPFPAPQEDCLNAIKAIFYKYKDGKKIIAGDSAGGALSIMSILKLQGSDSKADACVLISPWVDPLASSGTMKSNLAHDFLTAEFLKISLEALMNGAPISEQVRFNDVELSSLPPTLIQCGTGEIFFDQIQEFANRARVAGVKLTLQNMPQQFHVFQLLSPLLKDSRDAVNAIADYINAL